MDATSFRLPTDVLRALRTLARRRGVSQSALLSTLIREAIAKEMPWKTSRLSTTRPSLTPSRLPPKKP